MASFSRRSGAGFNLSFLDIMFCGFGAVVLLVLIISGKVIDAGKQKVHDRQQELLQLQAVYQQSFEKRKSLRNELEKLSSHVNEQEALKDTLAEKIKRISTNRQAPPDKGRLEALQQELKKLEAQKLQLEDTIVEQRARNNRILEIAGEGNRQYLTGLKLGGKRVLILIDSSASMLDRKIVDVIRLKVRRKEERQKADKWQRAVATVEWLLAHLPVDSAVQICRFDTRLERLDPAEPAEWRDANDFRAINSTLEILKNHAPENGTSLVNAFSGIAAITPAPDNIILITDGLPTQGEKVSPKTTISGEQRVRLFQQAVKKLPRGIPVNTILFPIEGDPMASVLFWKLALDTNGSFFTPTGDWP